jgi:prevent-host-death family protein
MTNVSIRDAKNHFTEIARKAEAGEKITITRNGRPVCDIIPHKPKTGLNFEALQAFKKEKGIDKIVTFIADDFNDPLPEDFLLQPLPF